MHQELGACFMHVSPGMNMFCTNDPVAIEHVFKKWQDFVKPEVFKTLDFFGPNIITVNGETWQRHRRLTAPCFNERISTFVWDESLRQSKDMLEDWLAKPKAKSNTVAADSGTVALHVITAAAFGEQRNYHEGVNILPPNHALTFRDAMRTVLRNPVTAAVTGGLPWLKNTSVQPLLSTRIRRVQLALSEFKSYMLESITRERRSLSTTSPDTTISKRPNLLNALIKASDSEKASTTNAKMSDEELTGNMFMFAFAGHETTATTISYALSQLALNQDIQDWVAEELCLVVGSSNARLHYAKTHPRLKRTLALMYETVRVFGVPPPWRSIAGKEPELLVSGPEDGEARYVVLPPDTQVSLNVFACHTSPEWWDDGETWNPKRWVKIADEIAEEQLEVNDKKFFGWGAGPRVCPGQSKCSSNEDSGVIGIETNKMIEFAQVEFTAVMATILTKHKVLPASQHDESYEMASEGLRKLVAASSASMAVFLPEPEKLWVKLVER